MFIQSSDPVNIASWLNMVECFFRDITGGQAGPDPTQQSARPTMACSTARRAQSMLESPHGHRTIRSLPDELRSRRNPRQTFCAPDTEDEIAPLLHRGGAELHGPGAPGFARSRLH